MYRISKRSNSYRITENMNATSYIGSEGSRQAPEMTSFPPGKGLHSSIEKRLFNRNKGLYRGAYLGLKCFTKTKPNMCINTCLQTEFNQPKQNMAKKLIFCKKTSYIAQSLTPLLKPLSLYTSSTPSSPAKSFSIALCPMFAEAPIKSHLKVKRHTRSKLRR